MQSTTGERAQCRLRGAEELPAHVVAQVLADVERFCAGEEHEAEVLWADERLRQGQQRVTWAQRRTALAAHAPERAALERAVGGAEDVRAQGVLARTALRSGLEGLATDLAVLSDSVVAAAREHARVARVLARAASRVPRHDGDTRGSSAWTSFLREVAVALRVHDRTASARVADAVLLTGRMPCVLAALEEGRLPVPQAQELVDVAQGCCDPVFVAQSPDGGAAAVEAVDALADAAARYRSWSRARVRSEADAAVLRTDADAVAARTAQANAARGVRLRTRAQRTGTAPPTDTAELVLDGPALALRQASEALDLDARALQARLAERGDRRGLDALRFDLAVHRLLGAHAPVLPEDDRLPDPASPSWWTDRRFSRPVQLQPLVPVTTLLGLSQEPGWVPGLGWVSAPTVRQLLPVAELRQVCVDEGGRVVDVAERVERPELTVAAVAAALQGMCTRPFEVTDATWRTEDHYRPGAALADLVRLRDGADDGPTGSAVPPERLELDHDQPYDHAAPSAGGPTAAWNLVARGTRTHQLKHAGWEPLRTADSTWWTSPCGQVVQVPHLQRTVLPLTEGARLPDPQALHDLEAGLLRPPDEDDVPPF